MAARDRLQAAVMQCVALRYCIYASSRMALRDSITRPLYSPEGPSLFVAIWLYFCSSRN